MKIRFLIFLLVPLVLLSVPKFVSANTNLGTVSKWNAYNNTSTQQQDHLFNEIARWSSTPYTKTYLENGFTSANFISYVNHGRNGWRNAGISINSTTTENLANLRIYGGTYSVLSSYDWRILSGYKGFTDYNDYIFEGIWTYSGDNSTKYGLRQNSARVFIIYNSNYTESSYKSIALHELGHALGWRGHSKMQHTGDVMFWNPNSTTLGNRDKEHLVQVY